MPTNADDSPRRLLLVDDEPIILATVADGLRGAGFAVTATASAAEAAEHARQGGFALAIVDYAMPAQNGLELAALFAKLRQPFIFLTAYGDDALVGSAVRAGALAFVVKPIDPVRLVPIVRAALERAREILALTTQAEQLVKSIETNRDVSVAVGLLMAQRGISRQAAYETLRQHARRTRRKLVDLALEVTAGAELLFGIPTADAAETAAAKSATPRESATPG